KEELKHAMADHSEVNHGRKAIAPNPPEPDPPKSNEDKFFNALLQDLVEPPPRIMTCPATEQEQAKYRALLAQIFAEETVIGLRVDFDPDDVLEVIYKTMKILKNEPMLIEDIPGGITVVTDIHGQLFDLHRIFESNSVDGKPGYECGNYLFLGDYVDRGDTILEVVMALFILKILYPDRVATVET
ncbi:hypothetical protein PFISCL1PPCAC_25958, partial [Pristionchus fissidentatus]